MSDLEPDLDPDVPEPDDGLTWPRTRDLAAMVAQPGTDDTWVYTGPLDEGRTLAERDRYVTVVTTDETTTVYLGDLDPPHADDYTESGTAADPDDAWRLALRAFFGPRSVVEQ